MTDRPPGLDALREQLDGLDREIVRLAAQRRQIARTIGAAKQATGTATRDFAREREVLDAARAHAAPLGLEPDVAEGLMRLLIESSLTAQEEGRVAVEGGGEGRRALVVGGRGLMGGWFVSFLRSQGYRVQIADPALPPASEPLDHDIVVVATPLRVTNAALHDLSERRPTGVVFDLGSLKSPLKTGLQALLDAGVRVCSIHPMFGPSARLLSGRHVIFCDLGVPGAVEEAQALFAPTMATAVHMDLEEHDRVMAYVLGISHALNISFFTALATSGELADRLSAASSTTFDAQLDVARRVASENPDLYFDIQALNDFGLDALTALEQAVGRVRQVVADRDLPAFRALMVDGRAYLDRRQSPG